MNPTTTENEIWFCPECEITGYYGEWESCIEPGSYKCDVCLLAGKSGIIKQKNIHSQTTENGSVSETPITDKHKFQPASQHPSWNAAQDVVQAKVCADLETKLTTSQTENAELKKKLASYEGSTNFLCECGGTKSEAATLTAENSELRKQRDQLKQLADELELFIDNHKPWCDSSFNKDKCNCGYDELLAKHAALTKEIV